ncbi:hypothetical protein DPMN_040032 [Dreissena polymorpha]|uniref:Uncharacterized protein n=1 Tax=Dreissena polymorpha TaxID=45954 RepID=A0A9D4HWH0_DREPO|nr:hypothetical protein DPMN_040032 [Dreissena polymorpha]
MENLFKLTHDIIRTNVLNKFREEWTHNLTSRVFTRETIPPKGSRVFQKLATIPKLCPKIIRIKVIGKFQEDWKNMCRLEFYSFSDIIGTNVLTNLHKLKVHKINVYNTR